MPDKNPLIPPELFISGNEPEPSDDEPAGTWLNVSTTEMGFRLPCGLEEALKQAWAEYIVSERDFLISAQSFAPGVLVHFPLSSITAIFKCTPELRARDREISKILEAEDNGSY